MKNNYFSLQWHITDQCDQRCKHCYIYNGKDIECRQQNLDLNTLILILNDFVAFCEQMNLLPYVHITGGDPLLYENIWEFLTRISEKNIRFSILGNPFHLNENTISKLEDLNCFAYQMSLDGLEKTHDSIRKSGSFKSTLDALKLFENSKIKSAIMSTVSKTNIEELPYLLDTVVSAKTNIFGFSRYCPSEDDINLMVSPEEYRTLLDKMWHKFSEYKNESTQFILKDHLWKLYLYENNLLKLSDIHNPDNLILDGCHCGITHMTVLSDGTVYACRRSHTPIGKVPNESFYNIFFSSAMDEYRNFDNFIKCKNCELFSICRGCPSVSKCVTGDFYSPDPQCWKK